MSTLVYKFRISILLTFCFVSAFSQNNLPFPQNMMFYMEINGNALNKKINWEKFNPILLEVTMDKDKKNSWNDYSKTGIKYDGTQYHYATVNDSVTAYTAHFTLDNPAKFQEFVNSTKKEGLEVTKKNKYSYISLDKETFVAWNDKHAVLKLISYTKPYKWEDENYAVDSAVVVADSTGVAIDSTYAGAPEMEPPFDYKEEINYLKEDIKYYKESIVDYQSRIKKSESDIKYLQKHHKYPDPPAEPEVKHEEEEEAYAVDDSYQKEMDSIDIANYKIRINLAEKAFDDVFNSNFNINVPKEKLKYRDAKADVFVYTDYANFMEKGLYGRMRKTYSWGNYLSKLYNSDSSYNLYFDKDKVRLINNNSNKNPHIQKSIADAYKGKKNPKLSKLISDKSIGYYSLNINGYKSFDLMYDMLKDMGDKDKFQQEINMFAETMKVVLDEEAISKIAPGNALFVLNKMSTKKVDYTDYEYDENYNEKEIKKTKDVAVPDFTFAFVTENEGYWNRFFDMLASNEETRKKFFKNGEFYQIKQKENSEIENLFFSVKNGIVYITTAKENTQDRPQSSETKRWAKESYKYAASGKLDVQKIVEGLEAEFKDSKEKELFNFLRKNVGNLTLTTNANSDSIQTEINYNINTESENSLMYFFDLMDMIYRLDKPFDVTQTVY